jgi:iron complex outermembrane recepter protein
MARFPKLWLRVAIVVIGLLLAIPGRAEGKNSTAKMAGVGSIESPATLKQRLVQSPDTVNPSAAPVPITSIQVNPTVSGIEVVLVTAAGKTIQTKTRQDGKTLIVEIDNAVLLALPDSLPERLRQRKPFVSKSSIDGIVSISATEQAGNRVEVRVTGDRSIPTATVTANSNGLVLAVTASKNNEEDLEITVTGERASSYRVPSVSSATRTDTPLRDIPQSIQVVPQQVLKDQKVTRPWRVTAVLSPAPAKG